jgi:hypothetical protein
VSLTKEEIDYIRMMQVSYADNTWRSQVVVTYVLSIIYLGDTYDRGSRWN